MIKIIIEQDAQVLNMVELSELQEKSLVLETNNISEFLTHKVERILDFVLEQAKQKFSDHEIEKKTDEELIAIANDIRAKKTLVKEEEEEPIGPKS